MATMRGIVYDYCLSVRPFNRPLMMFPFVLEQSERPPLPPKQSIIGCGGFSTVFLVKDANGAGKFALKRFDRGKFDPSTLMREAETLAKLNHPCIVEIRSFLLPSETEPAEIHMEYAPNGSLDRILTLVRQGAKPSFWTPTGIGIIICGIVLGMRFMHSHNFVHQDLKPANFLLIVDGRTLISDFGTSRCKAVDHTPTHDTGTPYYAAPELYEEKERTEKVDVFSFGLILYEVLVGRAVFPKSLTPMDIIRLHRAGERPEIPDTVFPVMKMLIGKCWSPNSSERPSFNDIIQEITSNSFQVVPGAQRSQIGEYVQGVLDWEQMYTAKTRAAGGG
jgi:serine/threonine protein kinase